MSEPDSRAEPSEERVLAFIEALCAADAALTPLSAAIVAAPYLGIASDTRAFARSLGVEHALVLRELTGLTDAHTPLVSITSRDDRTQRTFYALTAAGRALVDGI